MEKNNLERNAIENVVREVLTSVFKNSDFPNASKAVTGKAASEKATHLRPEGRRLADENIARWLGHAPTPQKARALPSLESRGLKASIQNESSGAAKEAEDKNQIPHPRKPEKLLPSLTQTPARIGVWRAGTRYLTKIALKLRADHAVAKDAVYAELSPDFATANNLILLHTKAKSKEEFLLRPDLGRQLDDASLKLVQEKAVRNPDIQITIADGLSAWAAERYAVPLVKELVRLCQQNSYSVGTLFCVKYSRIAIQDVIGEAVGAKISIILLGERPGLGSGDSLSIYMVYGPKVGIVNARKSMISNIHPLGHKPEDAARMTVDMFKKMFEQKCSGVDLHV